MGGLAGHMMHPHDNLKMKIGEFKDLTKKTLRGDLTMTEKIDGFNIHYLNYDGQLRLARNNKDLQNGGFSRADIRSRFVDRVADIFLLAYDLIEQEESWKNLPNFKDSHVTVNAEVVRAGTTNIMWYSESKIYKHGTYFWDIDLTTGKYVVERIEPATRYRVCFTPLDDQAADGLVEKLSQELFYQYGLSDEDTILDYYKTIFSLVMAIGYKEYLKADPKILGVLFNRFFGLDKTNLREIRKMTDIDIQPLLDQEKFIMRSTKRFIDLAVLGLGTTLLNRVDGINAKTAHQYEAAAYIEKCINNALHRVSKHEKEEFERRWAACNRKIFGIEGVVVNYNGQMYKWTGPFAPINQLIGGPR